jgi:hypothetical protein
MADSVAGLCTQLDSLLLDQPYLGTDEATFLLDDNRYIVAPKKKQCSGSRIRCLFDPEIRDG